MAGGEARLLDMAARQTTSPTGNGTGQGQGPTTSPETENRVIRLDAHLEYIRRDLEEIKAENRMLLEKLEGLTTALGTNSLGTERSIYDAAQRFNDAQGLIVQSLSELPSKRDLHMYAIMGIVIGLAIMGIVIGGIIGGLDWIKSY